MPGIYLAASSSRAGGHGVLDARFAVLRVARPGARRDGRRDRHGVLPRSGTLWGSGRGSSSGARARSAAGSRSPPELPLEEVFFLTFLCYLTMIVYSRLCAACSARATGCRDRTRGERAVTYPLIVAAFVAVRPAVVARAARRPRVGPRMAASALAAASCS